jgi:hypothetical protein
LLHRSLRLALQTLLTGAVLLAIASIGLSASLLHERLGDVHERAEAASRRIQSQSQQQRALLAARRMLEIRAARKDWSPLLSALSEKTEEGLVLVRLEGKMSEDGEGELEIWGESSGRDAQISVFTRFVETLGADDRFRGDFPELRLESVQDGANSRFQIVGGKSRS